MLNYYESLIITYTITKYVVPAQEINQENVKLSK